MKTNNNTYAQSVLLKKLKLEMFFFVQFLIYNLIVLEGYITGVDPYGFLVGLYFDTIVSYPLNLGVTFISIFATVLIGYITYLVIDQTKYSRYSQFIGHLTGFFIYLITIYSKYSTSAIYFTALILFVLKTSNGIENSRDKSIDVIKSHEKYLIIYGSLVLSITTINYFFYYFFYTFPGPVSQVTLNFTPWILLIFNVINPATNQKFVTDVPAPYVNLRNYYYFFKVSLVSAIILMGITLLILIFVVWHRMNVIIELKNKEVDIWNFDIQDSIIYQKLQFQSNTLDTLEKVEKPIIHEVNDIIYDLIELIEKDRNGLFIPDEAPSKTSSTDGEIEIELVENSKKIGEMMGLNKIIPPTVYKEVILLTKFDNKYCLENTMVTRNNKTIPLPNLASIIHYDDVPRLPFEADQYLKVLHIIDGDWNVQLLNRKIIQLFSYHHVKYDIISMQKNSDYEDFKEQNYDMTIISLHGIDTENTFSYKYTTSDGKEETIEAIHLWKNLNIRTKVLILPTCKTNSSKFMNELLTSKEISLIISSVTNVLSSHLNLIVLPIIEHFLELKYHTIYDISILYQKVRKIIDKFGYPIQWSQFRFITGIST